MKMKYCDLHNHSNNSDGSVSPSELIDYAIEKGLCAVALTDHNTIDGICELQKYAKDKNIEAVSGCEITTEFLNKETHLLALFIKEEKAFEMEEFLKERLRLKALSNIDLEKNLKNAGFKIDLSEMIEKYGKNINRAHFAKELINEGYVKTTKEAFNTILKPDGDYYKPLKRPEIVDTIRLVRKWEAVPVLAHPLLSLEKGELEKLLPEAKKAGLVGLEVYYPEFSKEQTEYLISLCEKYDLVKSGGSDYHGEMKTHSDLATATTPYENYIKLKNQN